MTGFLAEVFGAVQAVQVANAEVGRGGAFRVRSTPRGCIPTVRDACLDQMLQSIFWNTVNVGTGLILLIAGQAMGAHAFTVGDFALFIYYLGWITEFTALFGIMLTRYKQAASLSRAWPRCLTEPRRQPGAAWAGLSARCHTLNCPASPAHTGGALRTLEVSGLTYRYPGIGARHRRRSTCI